MQSLAQTFYSVQSPDYPTAAEAQARADYRADRQRHTVPAPVQHYATYHDLEGVATLRCGSGYTFQPDGSTERWLVSYKDADLVLLGRKDLADAQRAADELVGGFAAIVCGRR
jgi:hypothetical protein